MHIRPIVLLLTSALSPLQSGAGSDNFASRTLITGLPASDTGSNVGASAETGEPDHAFEPATASVWWTWTSTISGTVEINTHGSDFDTILAVYTGNTLASLTEVASNDESPQEPFSSRVRFTAAAGTVYQIAVDGWQGETGNITLGLLVPPNPPTNDNFAAPTVISASAPQTVNGTNVGAGTEADESVLGAGQTVWWRWTCPNGQGGTYQITSEGSLIDTVLAVYTGTALNNLARRALNDDIDSGATNLTSRVRFNATVGTVYRIAVDGAAFSGNAEGAITLNLSRITPAVASPTNDNLATPTALAGAAGKVNGSNVLASGQAGEPDHEFNPVAASVWYAWTPPSTPGTAEILLSFTNGVQGVVSVYSGTSFAALTRLDTLLISSFTNGAQRARFTPPSGQPLRIAVDGNFGDQAPFQLSYRHPLPAPPLNDNFANAHPLSGFPVSSDHTNNFATVEANDNDLVMEAMDSTVWFTWTCATAEIVRVSARTAELNPGIVVSTGSEATNLTYVAAGAGETVFNAVPGITYRIMVGSLTPEEGGFTLALEEAPALRPDNDPLASAWFLGSGNSGEAPGTLQYATLEAAEFTNGITRSVWYTWDAAYDGPAEALLQVLDPGVETRLNVYSGDSFTNLTPLTGMTGTNVIRVGFDATWNTRYALQVADDRSETATSQFTCAVTSRFPVTTFEITDFKRDALGNLMLEWPTVRGVEYNLYAGPHPGFTNNVLVLGAVATQNIMRVACCPPPTNTFHRLFVEATESAGFVEPGLP